MGAGLYLKLQFLLEQKSEPISDQSLLTYNSLA